MLFLAFYFNGASRCSILITIMNIFLEYFSSIMPYRVKHIVQKTVVKFLIETVFCTLILKMKNINVFIYIPKFYWNMIHIDFYYHTKIFVNSWSFFQFYGIFVQCLTLKGIDFRHKIIKISSLGQTFIQLFV